MTMRNLASVLVLGGCAFGADGPPHPATSMEIVAFSTQEASLGSLVEVYGYSFVGEELGDIALVFRGEFEADDGVTTPVEAVGRTRRVDSGTLRWTDLGPFAHPFVPDRPAAGLFRGTVTPRLHGFDGAAIDGQATPIEFRIHPSVVIDDFQPVGASCASAAVRAIAGLPYRIEARAMGFEPESFTYNFLAPAVGFSSSVRHIASSGTDVLGDDGSFVLPAIPDEAFAYGTVIRVDARARDGSVYVSTFAIGVHRPLEIFYNGNVQIAEVLAPVPVSACIPGGEAGRAVEYSESESESRERAYAIHWDENWLNSVTVGRSHTSSTTTVERNTFEWSTTHGDTFEWNWQAEGGLEIGLPKAIGLSFGGSGGQKYGSYDETRQGGSVTTGIDRTESTTDSTSVTSSQGGSEGEMIQWVVRSSEELGRDFSGHVIAGTYGVFYRQTLRLQRRAAVVTYNACGIPTIVGEVDFDDWAWSPDLALDHDCPPIPQSNLPAARCIIGPCAGE
jgi:hypothetical protein